MKILKFKRHHRMYTPGDVAGFADDEAQRLIDAGVAAEHTDDAKAEGDPSKAEPTKPAGTKK
ncbi:hypothetical protein P3W85_29950 [Cupriavidus basilensis]|uniref:Uncharacterized protein n=1 Tax=Cupriavidus basilensis TaxID=68895 RepID=A0ABT6AY21_9BURK|nr:hypothetical protein [Cupriavidus basilensis]MDF3837147.1 hypothetical protein [Cupriavidus basilensis]